MSVYRLDTKDYLQDLPEYLAFYEIDSVFELDGMPLTPIPELNFHGRRGYGYVATDGDSTHNLIFFVTDHWWTELRISSAVNDLEQEAASFELMQWVLDHYEDLNDVPA